MITYCRLFLIEQQVGNKPQADIDFQKAKYWGLIQSEYDTSATPENTDKSLKAFRKENVIKWITKLNPDFMESIKSLNRHSP